MVAGSLLGDHVVVEPAPMTFALKKGGEEIRATPLGYVTHIESKVLQLLDQNTER